MKRVSKHLREVMATVFMVALLAGAYQYERWQYQDIRTTEEQAEYLRELHTGAVLVDEFSRIVLLEVSREQLQESMTRTESYQNYTWLFTQRLDRVVNERSPVRMQTDSLLSEVSRLSTAVQVLLQMRGVDEREQDAWVIARRQIQQRTQLVVKRANRIERGLNAVSEEAEARINSVRWATLGLLSLLLLVGFVWPSFANRNRVRLLRKRQAALFETSKQLREETQALRQQLQELEASLAEREQQLHTANTSVLAKNNELRELRSDVENTVYILIQDLLDPIQSVANLLYDLPAPDTNQDEVWQNQFAALLATVQRLDRKAIKLREFVLLSRADASISSVYLNPFLSELLLGLNPSESGASIHIQEDLPVVRTHRLALERVLHAVLENGIKFADSKSPEIHIGCEEHETYLLFAITDNGAGIAREELTKVFDILHVSNAQDPRSGLGLGLAIAKKLVTDYGGSIWMESTPGRTTCYIRWPATVSHK
ncbi:MAG: hypothetical protein F6K11_11325 [Leptolyngbya sp. SIO3F4]|nr:hypothetical protein [Leptolyngbya sp. SIO3F4]